MPMPTSGVVASSGVVATSRACRRPSRARSGFAVVDALVTSQRRLPVRCVLEVDTNP
jgi:hypothetical protein